MTTMTNSPSKALEEFRKNDRRELSNELYAAICSRLEKYETRGFNAHSRSQTISEMVIESCERWLAIQHDSAGS